MSRNTIHTNMSLDACATTYAYVIAFDAMRNDDDMTNARAITRRVRTSIARDAIDVNDANIARMMRRVNDAIDIANATRTSCATRIDIDDARDVLTFVACYMTSHDIVAQRDRYIRRVARYARTIINDDVLMSRNETRHANARRNASHIVATR